MTKPVTRKMAIDCLLHRLQFNENIDFSDKQHGLGVKLICAVCKKPILPGQNIQFDHIHADVHEGPHEYQNLRPIHYDPCHKRKTARDIKDNAKVKRLRNPKPSKHPMKNSQRKIPTRKFPKGAKSWTTSRNVKALAGSS